MKYSCITFSQRSGNNAPAFCLFKAPVGEILAWAEIPRLTPKNKNGMQRAKSDYKVKAIKNFLAGDDRNTIPTAIVITLAPHAFEVKTIQSSEGSFEEIEIFQGVQNAAFVVDGQHRLYGLNEYDSKSNIPVVAILNATEEEKAFQFIVINNKVSKVQTDHIRALTLNFTDPDKELGLESRLNSARLSLSKNLGYVGMANSGDDSPFKGIISLPDNQPESRLVVPASIEASIAYIQSKNMLQSVSDDAPYEFFTTIWSTIKALWPNAFSGAKESKLLTKVGIQCMTQYVTDNIEMFASFIDIETDLSNAEDVAEATNKILALQSEAFWLSPWAISISDTKTVRDQLMESLKKIQTNIRSKHPWDTELPILGSE